MKRILAVLLAILVLTSASALAVKPEYRTTADFTGFLDEGEFSYTVSGVDKDGDEKVTFPYPSDKWGKIDCRFFFNADEDLVCLRVWDLIHYDEKDYAKVLEAVNTLNNEYKYLRFYAETVDNTVTASWDMCIPADNCGDTVALMLYRALLILDDSDAYELLFPYDK